ncbi:MAG: IPTL-CTERM sorting domain-containing protein [Pseudomonadota bacterium]
MKKIVLCLFIMMTALSQNLYAVEAANDTGIVFIPELKSAPPSGDVFSGTDSFSGTESTMSPRFFRSGTPGDSCSGFSSGNFQYKEHSFKSDATGSLTANFDPGTLGTGIFVTFHQESFNPVNICENYLWSFGSSQAFTNQTFSVPANTTIIMVVSGVANAPGVVGGPYSWSISGISIAPIPTLNEWGIILMGCLLAIGSVVMIRKNKNAEEV